MNEKIENVKFWIAQREAVVNKARTDYALRRLSFIRFKRIRNALVAQCSRMRTFLILQGASVPSDL